MVDANGTPLKVGDSVMIYEPNMSDNMDRGDLGRIYYIQRIDYPEVGDRSGVIRLDFDKTPQTISRANGFFGSRFIKVIPTRLDKELNDLEGMGYRYVR